MGIPPAVGVNSTRACPLKSTNSAYTSISIYCNRGGKKECGRGSMSLVRQEPAPKKVVKETGLNGIAAPEVEFKVVENKMSQKERKKANAEERARAEY
ncbi:hypothetical protein ONS95_012104 [Cadophora gregata]|uniref:uncharacterized protein n=1 Tax=Cadophora gregata TaxID=51156 RepID=UPI0026DD9815|nr:uncharacterized protein ONS95_012104 [Cadophora gregata]KAK0117779.1 hypothetical protein ONS95_012104 [Cadophora gregata]